MDTAKYRAFVVTAEIGNIKNAANVLGYTPSAVSQLIKSLEQELSMSLFIRHRDGVSLSYAGSQIIPIVREVLSKESEIYAASSDIHHLIQGEVNVACYPSVISDWFLNIVFDFQTLYPNIRINIREETQEAITNHIQSGIADIAFFSDSLMTVKHDWTPLYSDRLMAVVPSTHPKAHLKSFNIDSFRGERFIMPESGIDWDVLNILNQHNIKPKVCISTISDRASLAFVEKGSGVTIVNSFCLLNYRSDKIKAIPLEPSGEIQIGMVVLNPKQISPTVHKFYDFAHNSMRGGQPVEEGQRSAPPDHQRDQ